MPEMIMLCGIPTSGKSTYSKDPKYKDYIRISSDDILDEIAKKQEKSYSAVFQKNIQLAQRAMLIVLRNAIKQQKNIIWDQTNTTAKMRMEKLGMVPKNYTKKAIWFGVSLKDALIRNTKREGKIIPPDVIERMHKEFEIPSTKEGFDEVKQG